MKKISKTTSTKRPSLKPHLYSPNVITTKSGSKIRRKGSALGSAGSQGSMSGNYSQSLAQSPLYYDYRWSSPDKFYFPRNRVVANSIWREIYKRDPAVAIGTDLYAELPWSEYDLSDIEDKTVLRTYEDMSSEINIVPKLSGLTRDYLITGELILHNIFDSIKGIWSRIIPHDPDYIKAVGVGLALEQPLLWLLPTPEIKRLLTATDPRIRKLQKLIPREVLNAFRSNREVPLDSLNTTFLARLNSSSNIRGTSLYTRLFRVVMYEDFVINASLAVSQRHAAPLRIFKLGDPQSGWIADDEDVASFSEMLSMAESDPLAAIVMHHNVQCELVGVQERVLLISKEWDYIERVKLLALGIAKSFLVGESSFAAAVAGMQSLLDRLQNLRTRFEKEWIIKKIYQPIAEIQEFYRRPKSELDHRIRIKKPFEERELMLPTIKWKKNLESTQDVAILNIWRDLKERGIVSERTYAMGAGVDIDTERKNIAEERRYKEEHPEIYGVPGQQPSGPAGLAMPKAPGAPKPGMPPPPASSVSKRNNPYQTRTARAEMFADELSWKIDKEGKVAIDDALETLEEVEDDLEAQGPKEAALENLAKKLGIPDPSKVTL